MSSTAIAIAIAIAGDSKNQSNLLDSSLQMTVTRQKKNIYHLALSILEIGGLTRQQTHTLLMNAGLFYTGSLKSILEALEKKNSKSYI